MNQLQQPAINNAYHNSEVETALNDAKPKIEAIVPKVRKKRSALDELQASADNQIRISIKTLKLQLKKEMKH